MSAHVSNIDVILDTEGLDVPACPHGPALLFAKYDQNGKKSGEQRNFFACSAFRDRKQCRFFQYADEKVSKAKLEQRKLINESFSPRYKHAEFWERFQRVADKNLPASSRQFCVSCELLLLPDEEEDHTGHQLKTGLSRDSFQLPSQLFQPMDDNKTYAENAYKSPKEDVYSIDLKPLQQYLFASSSVSFTLESLKQLSVSHVLCVGTPRIHEAILSRQVSEGSKTESLLLDLDHRYMQVYSPKHFCHFNMFNFHFFGSLSSQQVYEDFVSPQSGKQVAIVTDPPFGGLVEALAATMSKIMSNCMSSTENTDAVDSLVPVLWFFPYFLEKRIVEAIPSMHMLDYKVDYDNHTLFSGRKKSKKGSPVRIFTNVPMEQLPLPADEGYRWCKKCQRYSSEENKHCDRCGLCTSKDGSSYVHCDTCQRCVKPSWVHCNTCGRCQLQDHKCGVSVKSGCHICGHEGHKRRDCPKKITQTRKRQKNEVSQAQGHSEAKRRKKSKQKK